MLLTGIVLTFVGQSFSGIGTWFACNSPLSKDPYPAPPLTVKMAIARIMKQCIQMVKFSDSVVSKCHAMPTLLHDKNMVFHRNYLQKSNQVSEDYRTTIHSHLFGWQTLDDSIKAPGDRECQAQTDVDWKTCQVLEKDIALVSIEGPFSLSVMSMIKIILTEVSNSFLGIRMNPAWKSQNLSHLQSPPLLLSSDEPIKEIGLIVMVVGLASRIPSGCQPACTLNLWKMCNWDLTSCRNRSCLPWWQTRHNLKMTFSDEECRVHARYADYRICQY